MKIAFIGGGNMGEAILAAVLDKGLAAPSDISVSDISPERLQYLQDTYSVTVTDSSPQAVTDKEIVVLAVKPQHIAAAAGDIRGKLLSQQLVLSILAGVKITTIQHLLDHFRTVRVMPNTPAQIGIGMSGWTASSGVTIAQKEMVSSVLSSLGKEVYFEDEDSLDMVTAVSGSGPAYVFLFAECLADAAVEIGLSRENADLLVRQTVFGAAHLIDESGESPAALRRKVSSKGGTTIEALRVFEENNLADIVRRAVRAAYVRAQELGS